MITKDEYIAKIVREDRKALEETKSKLEVVKTNAGSPEEKEQADKLLAQVNAEIEVNESIEY